MDIETIVGYGLAALFVGFVVYKMFFNKKGSSKLGGRGSDNGGNSQPK